MAIPVRGSKAAAAQLLPAPLSWGCHPQRRRASQTDFRYFSWNKPKKQSKTRSRPQMPNRASTGKTGPYLTPCFPLAHACNSSQLKSPVFGNQGYPDVEPESHKRGQSSEGTWEAAGTELTPTPNTCALAGIDVTVSGGRKLYLKGAQLQRELRQCQVHGILLRTTPPFPKSRC